MISLSSLLCKNIQYVTKLLRVYEGQTVATGSILTTWLANF